MRPNTDSYEVHSEPSEENTLLSFLCAFCVFAKRLRAPYLAGVIILGFAGTIAAQTSFLKSEKSLSANFHAGFVIPHRPVMRSLVTGHTKGFELTLEIAANETKEWRKVYKNPSLALDLFAASLGNPEQLGDQYHLLLGPILPLNPGKKVRLTLHLGMGPGISTKKWDLETNYQSTPIGSTLNASILAQLGIQIPATKNININAGARMSHLSNAAFKLPNLGTNIASLYFGVHFGEHNEAPIIENPAPDNLSYALRNFSASLKMGLREILPPGGEKYQMWSLTIGHDWRRTYKSAFGLFADVMYNENLTPLLLSAGDNSVTNSDNVRLGLAGAYTIHFEQWHIKFMTGTYLRNEFKRDGSIYNRVALRYNLPKGLFFSLGMKTHLTVADHWEWGLGYSIQR